MLAAGSFFLDSATGWWRYVAFVGVATLVYFRVSMLRRRWGRIRSGGRAAGSATASSRPLGMGQTQVAGWYPDPAGEALLRWWDGDEWTARTRQDHP